MIPLGRTVPSPVRRSIGKPGPPDEDAQLLQQFRLAARIGLGLHGDGGLN
jgi:hypothetical protein